MNKKILNRLKIDEMRKISGFKHNDRVHAFFKKLTKEELANALNCEMPEPDLLDKRGFPFVFWID